MKIYKEMWFIFNFKAPQLIKSSDFFMSRFEKISWSMLYFLIVVDMCCFYPYYLFDLFQFTKMQISVSYTFFNLQWSIGKLSTRRRKKHPLMCSFNSLLSVGVWIAKLKVVGHSNLNLHFQRKASAGDLDTDCALRAKQIATLPGRDGWNLRMID